MVKEVLSPGPTWHVTWDGSRALIAGLTSPEQTGQPGGGGRFQERDQAVRAGRLSSAEPGAGPWGVCLGAASAGWPGGSELGRVYAKEHLLFYSQGHMEATCPLAEDRLSPGTNACPRC